MLAAQLGHRLRAAQRREHDLGLLLRGELAVLTGLAQRILSINRAAHPPIPSGRISGQHGTGEVHSKRDQRTVNTPTGSAPVSAMDLEAFYGAYRRDGRGRPAYEPAMMVSLLLYAYARGMRSSRAIERACEEDVAFRVIAAQHKPDHATVARFLVRHQDALAGVFGEVLTLCA